MSSSQNSTETAQQHRDRLLLAQAERQRIREEEAAKQEAEFAAEMERLEEEAAREEEEKRLAEEKRVVEEKRVAEENRLAEEKRIAEKKLAEERELAEAMRLEDERIAELKRFEEEMIIEEKRRNRIAEEKRREEERLAEAEDLQEQNDAFAKFIKENRIEKAKAAKKLERRREPVLSTARPVVSVVIPPRASGSKAKTYKSKSVISDDSDEAGVESEVKETPRGTKRKRTIKMIARSVGTPDPIDEVNAEDEDDGEPPSSSQPRSACTRCVLLGKPESCRPQTTRRKTQACELCHVQQQRCSWIGDHASRRSRGKRAKLEDDIYRGPAARVTERKFAGPEVAEQLAVMVGQNIELVGIARRSLEVEERILTIMERREQRELREREVRGKDEDEDEDEDGEGEEDEEEKEKNNEKRKNEIREGKRRAE
ncbi:hypothetical protein F5050DRAFT_1813473 [Lentinula boryana]|uniref:Uncharacterized protein n=1 Tax=Lentinula boryana TaxID=40481 RepID=A0ABQ8PXG1_9AGAR|nr:hypothetical protein F5050DRAFT_1813473 [Lentinula boryana]